MAKPRPSFSSSLFAQSSSLQILMSGKPSVDRAHRTPDQSKHSGTSTKRRDARHRAPGFRGCGSRVTEPRIARAGASPPARPANRIRRRRASTVRRGPARDDSTRYLTKKNMSEFPPLNLFLFLLVSLAGRQASNSAACHPSVHLHSRRPISLGLNSGPPPFPSAHHPHPHPPPHSHPSTQLPLPLFLSYSYICTYVHHYFNRRPRRGWRGAPS